MVSYYRLKEFGFHLPETAHILHATEIEPLEAATHLIQEAETKAARIIEDAHHVYDQERLRGYKEGAEEARVTALQKLMEDNHALDVALAALEYDLEKLVMTCVKKIIDGFDRISLAQSVVRSGLRQMRREKRVQLRVSSEHYPFFHKESEKLKEGFPEIELIDVVEDPMLNAPQVILESSIGRIEGDIPQRLEDMEHIVTRILGYAGSSIKIPAFSEQDLETPPLPSSSIDSDLSAQKDDNEEEEYEEEDEEDRDEDEEEEDSDEDEDDTSYYSDDDEEDDEEDDEDEEEEDSDEDEEDTSYYSDDDDDDDTDHDHTDEDEDDDNEDEDEDEDEPSYYSHDDEEDEDEDHDDTDEEDDEDEDDEGSRLR